MRLAGDTAGVPATCTLGFVMRDVNGVREHSTAGHCTGSQWYHGGRLIGPTAFSDNSSNRDFKVIGHRNTSEPVPANWVYRSSGNNAAEITTKVTNVDTTLLDDTVCHAGMYGGERCGTINSLSVTFGGRPGFGQHTGSSCDGDSGAPVYNSGTNRAYGILKGYWTAGAECGAPTVFTWINVAEWVSQRTVLLKGTTEGLGHDQRLNGNMYLETPNAAYRLVMQYDGNLVGYPGPFFASNTAGNSGAWLTMQADGNLVIRKATASGVVVVWSTNSDVNSPGRLLIQYDRNIVIYGLTGNVIWASNTAI